MYKNQMDRGYFMDFKTFTAQNFNGDEEKAHQHLVTESYYGDYSLTGSREDLQIILDTMTKEEAKVFMRHFKQAVKKDSSKFRKDAAPFMDVLRGSDSSWQFDENFILQGNPFGTQIKKYLLLSLLGIVVLGVLLLLNKYFNGPEAVFYVVSMLCLCFASVMAGKLTSAITHYNIFKNAEKALQKSKADPKVD